MSLKVIDIQSTPNPNAAKFVLDGHISDRPTSFFSAEAGKDHPVASRLFGIDGVTSVLLLGDFVTVNKRGDIRWSTITERISAILEGR